MSEQKIAKDKEPMFSAKVLKLLKNPLNLENPVTVQVLGICSALAVTVQMKPAIVMALSVTVVTAFSNLIISALRRHLSALVRSLASAPQSLRF